MAHASVRWSRTATRIIRPKRRLWISSTRWSRCSRLCRRTHGCRTQASCRVPQRRIRLRIYCRRCKRREVSLLSSSARTRMSWTKSGISTMLPEACKRARSFPLIQVIALVSYSSPLYLPQKNRRRNIRLSSNRRQIPPQIRLRRRPHHLIHNNNHHLHHHCPRH